MYSSFDEFILKVLYGMGTVYFKVHLMGTGGFIPSQLFVVHTVKIEIYFVEVFAPGRTILGGPNFTLQINHKQCHKQKHSREL